MKAAILCAGFGKRLKNTSIQKSFLIFKNEKLIDRHIRLLRKAKIKKIYIILRKRNTELYNYLKTKYRDLILIQFNSKSALDSTLSLKKYTKKNEKILVINIDAIYSTMDLKYFLKRFRLVSFDMCLWVSKINTKYNVDPAYTKILQKKIISYGKKIPKENYVFGQVRICSNRILKLKDILVKNKRFKMDKYINFLIRHKYKVKIYLTKKNTFDIDTLGEALKINKYLINNENF
jgi:NDP-sugar pyrophosphorylase family protein